MKTEILTIPQSFEVCNTKKVALTKLNKKLFFAYVGTKLKKLNPMQGFARFKYIKISLEEFSPKVGEPMK